MGVQSSWLNQVGKSKTSFVLWSQLRGCSSFINVFLHTQFNTVHLILRMLLTPEYTEYAIARLFTQGLYQPSQPTTPTHTHTHTNTHTCKSVGRLTYFYNGPNFAVAFHLLGYFQPDMPLGTLHHICASLVKRGR